jgi:hypothetical protein
MPQLPITANVKGIDLSGRIAHSEAVVASPAAAAETTIATVTIPLDVAVNLGVFLFGWAAWTVGTNGVSANLKLRQTDTSGSTRAATGALTETAGNLYSHSVIGFDSAPTAAGVYVLTLTVASGSAASTVSAVELLALVV